MMKKKRMGREIFVFVYIVRERDQCYEKDLELKWDYGNATGSVILWGSMGTEICECDGSNEGWLRCTMLVTISEV